MFVSRESQLANVDDVFNGIMVRGDATGDVVFYGKGAGKLPTASAVVADVIDCAKQQTSRKFLYWGDAKEGFVDDIKNDVTSFYVRVQTVSEEYALQKADEVFGPVRELARKNREEGEAGFITPSLPEYEIEEKLAELEKHGIKVLSKIRVSDY